MAAKQDLLGKVMDLQRRLRQWETWYRWHRHFNQGVNSNYGSHGGYTEEGCTRSWNWKAKEPEDRVDDPEIDDSEDGEYEKGRDDPKLDLCDDGEYEKCPDDPKLDLGGADGHEKCHEDPKLSLRDDGEYEKGRDDPKLNLCGADGSEVQAAKRKEEDDAKEEKRIVDCEVKEPEERVDDSVIHDPEDKKPADGLEEAERQRRREFLRDSIERTVQEQLAKVRRTMVARLPPGWGDLRWRQLEEIKRGLRDLEPDIRRAVIDAHMMAFDFPEGEV